MISISSLGNVRQNEVIHFTLESLRLEYDAQVVSILGGNHVKIIL
jgi:hypothetical protein